MDRYHVLTWAVWLHIDLAEGADTLATWLAPGTSVWDAGDIFSPETCLVNMTRAFLEEWLKAPYNNCHALLLPLRKHLLFPTTDNDHLKIPAKKNTLFPFSSWGNAFSEHAGLVHRCSVCEWEPGFATIWGLCFLHPSPCPLPPHGVLVIRMLLPLRSRHSCSNSDPRTFLLIALPIDLVIRWHLHPSSLGNTFFVTKFCSYKCDVSKIWESG